MRSTKLLLAALAVAGALGGILPPAIAQQATPSEEAALQAYREGAFSRAVQLYTRALSETDDPQHRSQLHVSIAWTLFALGRQGEVDTHIRAALVEDPDLSLVPDYYTKEFIELFEAARTRARSAARDASGVSPADLEATLATVQDRMEEGRDLGGALADVERLAASYPADGRLIPLRVELLRRLGRDAEADQLMRAYGPGTTDVPVEAMSIPDLVLRANRLLDDGDVEGAFVLLREAVARQPSNVAALELMAEASVRSRRWQDAEFALKSALALQPDNLGLQLRLGGVYLARNDTSAARDVFRGLTEQYPHSDRAWAALGLLDAQLGNTERAVQELSQALAENPLLPEVQLGYGELMLQQARYSEALQAFASAETLLPDDSHLEARIGQALQGLGRHEEALQHLRAAVEGGFRPFDVQRSLVLALVTNGLHAEAERLLADLPSDGRNDLEVARGMLLLEQGSADRAETVLRSAAEARPSDAAVLNLLAKAVYQQGRFEEAVALLERATEIRPEDAELERNLELARAAASAERLAAEAEAVRPGGVI